MFGEFQPESEVEKSPMPRSHPFKPESTSTSNIGADAFSRPSLAPSHNVLQPSSSDPQDTVTKLHNSFRYPKLGPCENIRLIIIQPGQPLEPITCNLVAASFAPGPVPHYSYQALSYSRGSEQRNYPIQFYSSDLGFSQPMINSTFLVRPNLHAALLALRSKTSKVVVWVDALCIDQSNEEEKQAQYSILTQIFYNAENVCVWLGPENAVHRDAAGVFGLMREMLNLSNLEPLLTGYSFADHWEAFIRLLSNEWFSRKRVIECIAFARKATVRYGSEEIRWDDFADTVALFRLNELRVRELLAKAKRLHGITNTSVCLPTRAAFSLIETTSCVFRWSPDRKIKEKLMTLEALVSSLNVLVTTDPRHTIYSLLSVARDTSIEAYTVHSPLAELQRVNSSFIDSRIIPDYSMRTIDVFIGFVDYCIERSISLDIICRHWAGSHQIPGNTRPVAESMPTFILDVRDSAFGDPKTVISGRLNGDEFVGIRGLPGQQTYNASGGLLPCWYFGVHSYGARDRDIQGFPLDLDDLASPSSSGIRGDSADKKQYDGTLVVKGIIVDTIDQVSPRLAGGTIPQECLELGGWSNNALPDRVPEELWRTLVADRGKDGKIAPSWYGRACLQAFQHVTQNGDLETGALVSSTSTPPTVISFLERMRAVTWNRRLIKSKVSIRHDETLLGLAPPKTKRGDILAILFGCSVPVVLRQGGSGGLEYYEFIGEAYVHGIMDGEAVAGRGFIQPYENAETFTLR